MAGVGSTTVVRRSELDPNVEPVDNEQWTKTVTSDPATDRIVMVVADAPGCQEVGITSMGNVDGPQVVGRASAVGRSRLFQARRRRLAFSLRMIRRTYASGSWSARLSRSHFR